MSENNQCLTQSTRKTRTVSQTTKV